MEKLQITYSELAFIMQEEVGFCKDIFLKIKEEDKVKAIFYKICLAEQIKHAEQCLNASFKFLYPKGLNPKKAIS